MNLAAISVLYLSELIFEKNIKITHVCGLKSSKRLRRSRQSGEACGKTSWKFLPA